DGRELLVGPRVGKLRAPATAGAVATAGGTALVVDDVPVDLGDHLAELVDVAVGEVVDDDPLGEGARLGAVEADVGAARGDGVVPVHGPVEADPGRGEEGAQPGPAELHPREAPEDERGWRHRSTVRRT